MEIAHLATILAAEPASIFYMISGAVGLLFARRRGQPPTGSSVAMLFCRKQTHDRLNKLKLV